MTAHPSVSHVLSSLGRREFAWRALLLLASVALYIPVCVRVGDLGRASGDYSHVFVMPLIAAVVYLLTRPFSGEVRERRLFSAWLWGTGVVFAGVGFGLHHDLLVKLTLPVTLLGAVGVLFGWREALRFRLAAFLLLFALGLPTDLILLTFSKGLSLTAAGIAHDVVNSLLPSNGPYILRQSAILTPSHTFDVVQSCSGTRWLVALFILGTLVAWKLQLSVRAALRFAAALGSLALIANVIRICLTLMTTLLMTGRYTFDRIHSFWNVVIVAACILALPALASRAGRWRLYLSAVRVYAVLVMVGFALTMYLKALEGTTLKLSADPQTRTTRVLVQDGLPQAMQPFLSPGADKPFRFAWIACSGFVHAGTMHCLTNLAVLILIGAALRQSVHGRWWPAIPLAVGQVAGALAGWLMLADQMNSARQIPVLAVGASGAVSGLFGAFLIALICAHRRWRLAAVYGAVYVASLALEAAPRSPSHLFSVTAHVVAVLTGAASMLVLTKMHRPVFLSETATCEDV